MTVDSDDKKTITLDQYMIQKLGGLDSVNADYIREIAQLNKPNGNRKTLGEIIELSDENGAGKWLRGLTLPQLSILLFDKPMTDKRKYYRRNRTEIEACRRDILDVLSKFGTDNKMTVKEIASRVGAPSLELKAKDLDVLVSQGKIVKIGTAKGEHAEYSIATEK